MTDKKRKTKNRSKLVILIIILFLILAEGLILYYDHIADDSSILGSTEDSITNTTDSYLEVAFNSVPVLNDTLGEYLPSNDVNISEIQLERRIQTHKSELLIFWASTRVNQMLMMLSMSLF